jgi:hypothetical protein
MHNEAKNRMLTILSVTVLMVSIPAFAHHGTNISYDHNRPITFKATVTEFRYTNPHCQVYFDVKDDKGDVEHWSGELTSPYNLTRAGWPMSRSLKELPPGTPVTITLFPSKAGTPVGVVSKVLNAKGEEILVGRE